MKKRDLQQKIQRATNIYTNEGAVHLINKSIKFVKDNYLDSPAPAVTNSYTPRPLFALKHLYNLKFNLYHGTGIDIMSEDWDTLIILDACRFDDFRRVNSIEGRLETRISRAVDSRQFIQKNFCNRSLHNTVYVTANPHVHLLNGNEFYDTVTDPLTKWNAELQCIEPHAVTEAALKTHHEYPEKRIIVHYMQPHDPPLGPTGDHLRTEYQLGGPDQDGTAPERDRIMELVADGTIDVTRARKAYRETISVVLKEVNSILSEITARTVITADHGELFGEKPYPFIGELFEHYQNPRTVKLCKVPWLIIEADADRREISSEGPADDGMITSEKDITSQLEALGYK